MRQIMYFLGRALQLVGLATLTIVVYMFFTQMGMEPLLYATIAGIVEFYAGTFILKKAGG